MQTLNTQLNPTGIRATHRQQITFAGQAFVLYLTTHRSAHKAAELYTVNSDGLEIFVKYASHEELSVFGIYDR